MPKGIGLAEPDNYKRNDIPDGQRWTGADYERRNAYNKHGPHNVNEDPGDDGTYDYHRSGERDYYQDTDLSQQQIAFMQAFDEDFGRSRGSGRGPYAPNTTANDQVLQKKREEWLARAKRYGLTPQEAQQALDVWLERND